MGKVLVLAGVNLMGGFNFGYNTGVIAGILGIFQDFSKDHRRGWDMDESKQGIVAASILIGALFGSMIGGPISDRFGRRVGVIVLSVITIVAAPLLAAAPTLDLVIAARTLLGVGVGMSGVICPMYVGETAPPERRGSLGILFQLAITVGILLAYISNYALEHVKHNWRIMFVLGAVPAILLLLLGFIMPESPVWKQTRGINGEGSSLIRTNDSMSPLRSPPLSVRLSLFMRSRALFIGLVLAVAQQLTGINAFMYYAKSIFGSAGIKNQNYPTMGLGAWNAVTTVLAIPLVDRLGRRPLLLVGTMIMSAACIGLGLTYQFAKGTALGALAIILLLLFVAAFEVGDGPLFWIVASELFTPEIKTVGASTLNAAQWLLNIALTLGFPVLEARIHETVFYIFGGIGIACSVIMFIALPETRVKDN